MRFDQEARYVLHVACFVRVLIAIHSNITSLQVSLRVIVRNLVCAFTGGVVAAIEGNWLNVCVLCQCT